MSGSSPDARPADRPADHSVRIAWADDAPTLAALQLRTWPERYGHLLPAEALPQGEEALATATQAWRGLLARPAEARQRVLVALDRARVVGSVLTSPATDPDADPGRDAELHELTVAAEERRRGHGTRLLQAAVDTVAADRFSRVVTWVLSDDDALRALLTSAGWAADGAHRELDLDGSGTVRVRQVRLHTAVG